MGLRGAVQAAAHADFAVAERLRDAGGGQVADVEAHNAGAAARVARGVNGNAGDRAQRLIQCLRQKVHALGNRGRVFANVLRAGAKPLDSGQIQRAGFVSFRQLLRLHEKFGGAAGAALAQRFQPQPRRKIESAGALRAQQRLVAGKRVQVAAEGFDVHGKLAERLRAVDQ